MDEIKNLRRALVVQCQLHGHDLAEAKGEQLVFLRDRLKPLLSDAKDALEIDPPAMDVALRRIKASLAAIDREVNRHG